MSSFHVLVHPEALGDIERNTDWWADNHDSVQALSWYENAIRSIHRLKRFPASHPLAAEHGDFSFELRELLFGPGSRPSFRALFVIRGDTVHVLAIRRAAQDRFTRRSLPDDFQ